MKKIDSRDVIYETYKGYKFYKDDLVKIYEIMSLDGTRDVIIQDDDNIYDNLDEIIEEKGMFPKIIKIESRKKGEDCYRYPIFSIKIDRNLIRLGCYSCNDHETKAIKHDVSDFIRNRSRFIFKILNPYYSFYLVLFFVYLLSEENLQKMFNEKVINILEYVLVILVLHLLISFIYRKMRAPLILKNSHEVEFRSFFDNIKHDLFIAAFSCFFGVFIGYFLK